MQLGIRITEQPCGDLLVQGTRRLRSLRLIEAKALTAQDGTLSIESFVVDASQPFELVRLCFRLVSILPPNFRRLNYLPLGKSCQQYVQKCADREGHFWGC